MSKENLIHNELSKISGRVNKRVLTAGETTQSATGRFCYIQVVTTVEFKSITYSGGTTGDSLPLDTPINPQEIAVDFTSIEINLGSVIIYEELG